MRWEVRKDGEKEGEEGERVGEEGVLRAEERERAVKKQARNENVPRCPCYPGLALHRPSRAPKGVRSGERRKRQRNRCAWLRLASGPAEVLCCCSWR